MLEKPLVWVGSSLDEVRGFPEEARRVAGAELRSIQKGEDPFDWKPMPSIGLGVRELRVWAGGSYRVIYLARFAEAVYVLHAFQKGSRRTPQRDIDLAKARLKHLLRSRPLRP